VIYEVQTLSLSLCLSVSLCPPLKPPIEWVWRRDLCKQLRNWMFSSFNSSSKKNWQMGKIPSSHACVFCKAIKLQFMNSSAKSRLRAMSPARGPVAKNVQKLKFLKSRDASWVLCKRIVVLELETL
jgi:hypothetical protein